MALATRRIISEDGDGGVSEDYEATGVVRRPTRVLPHDADTPGRRRRYAKLRAIVALRGLGWKEREIALALDYTERHVSRQRGMIRAIAEAAGRV